MSDPLSPVILDAVRRGASPLDASPIAGGIVGGAYDAFSNTFTFPLTILAGASTSSTAYVDVINVTGAGYIDALIHQFSAGTSGSSEFELIIDGVTVVSTSQARFGASAQGVRVFVGNVATYYAGGPIHTHAQLGTPIPFRESLQVRHKNTTAGMSTVYYHYVRTA